MFVVDDERDHQADVLGVFEADARHSRICTHEPQGAPKRRRALHPGRLPTQAVGWYGLSMRLPVLTVGVLPLVSASLLAGCSPAFKPASLVDNERLIAVVTEPPEAVPGRQITLTPVVAAPRGTLEAGADYQVAWWRCPDSDSDALGDFSQCTHPAERRTVGSGAPFVDVVPADVFGALPDPGQPLPEDTPGPDNMLGALLGYWRVIGVEIRAGERVVNGFKRTPTYLPFALSTIDERLADLDTRINAAGVIEENANPIITAVTIHEGAVDGPSVLSVKKGGTYFFQPRIDERALQSYFSLKADLAGLDLEDPEQLGEVSVDELLPRFQRVQRCEIPTFNWFATAGSVRREITLDEGVVARVYDGRGVDCPPVEGDARTPETEFTAPTGEEDDPLPEDGVLRGWVVVRDGRGGTAVRAFELDVED